MCKYTSVNIECNRRFSKFSKNPSNSGRIAYHKNTGKFLIVNSNHPLATNAKYLSRVAKNEMTEMEICPDCFKNFYTVTDTSFAEPCRQPHQLVFARVKGYPLWPAKVVRLGKQNDVDCRFFGTHDRYLH
jgi:hypothetical protein